MQATRVSSEAPTSLPGQTLYGWGSCKPIEVRLEVLFDMGAWLCRETYTHCTSGCVWALQLCPLCVMFQQRLLGTTSKHEQAAPSASTHTLQCTMVPFHDLGAH